MAEERICPYCGKTFFRKSNNQKYCSKKCKERYRAENRNPYGYEPIHCANCGIEFVPSRFDQKFCCRQCSTVFHNRQHCEDRKKLAKDKPHEVKICPVCNAEFTSDYPFQKFCSCKCRQRSAYNYVPPTPEPRACETCGKIFLPTHANRKYCSDACRPRIRHERASWRLPLSEATFISQKEYNRRLRQNRERLLSEVRKARELGLTYGQYEAIKAAGLDPERYRNDTLVVNYAERLWLAECGVIELGREARA